MAELSRFTGQIVIGPRSGSRDADFAIPPELPPGPLQAVFPGKVARVESLRPGLTHPGEGWEIARWLEQVETDAEAEMAALDGTVTVWRHGQVRYLAAWPEPALAGQVLERAARDAGLVVHRLADGLRLRRAGGRTFAFNYATTTCSLTESVAGKLVLGERTLLPAGVTVLDDG
jgi:beta-galactosidase